MATTILTQPVLRKAFKRTFLQDVTAKVTFAGTNLLGNGIAIRSFLRDRFGITNDFNLPKLDGIDIVSESKSEKYNFTTTSATVTMDSNIYRYFEDSLKPRLDVIISYLQALGIDEIETFSIIKRNLFQATAKNAFQAWKIALVEAFKVDIIRGMADSPNIPTKPFKLSIEGSADTEWGEIRFPFTVDVPDKSNFNFRLDLEAISKSIHILELINRGVQMNNDIFVSFTDIISDKLIHLMQQD